MIPLVPRALVTAVTAATSLPVPTTTAVAAAPFSALHSTLLTTTTFFSTSVFSICLLFATVIMPGLATLLPDNAAYLRAFQAVDGVIQNNQPVFMFTWVASLVSTAALLGKTCTLPRHALRQQQRWVLIPACLLFLLGHVTTVVGNLPLNNALFAVDIAKTATNSRRGGNASVLEQMRRDFAGPWNRWNTIRTVLFGISSVIFTFFLTTQGTATRLAL